MKDLNYETVIRAAINPAVRTADATSPAIDLQGFNSALIVITTGAAVSSGLFSAKVRECATSGGTYADVAAEDLNGAFAATMTANDATKVGYRGNKRFIKVQVTYVSGTSLIIGANVTLGNPDIAPAA